MRTTDNKKTLAYAVNFIFENNMTQVQNFKMGSKMYKFVNSVSNIVPEGWTETIAVVYDYEKQQYMALNIDDEKIGSKKVVLM